MEASERRADGQQPRGLARLLRSYRTVVRFSLASTTHSAATMLASLVLLRWVSPEDLGLWHSLLLVQSYSLLLTAGVFNGLSRELPFRLGAKDPVTHELTATAQAVATGTAVILAILSVGAFFASDDPRLKYVLPAVLLCTGGTLYQQFLVVTYRSDRSFAQLAVIRWVQAITTVATLPMVYWLGYYGLPLRFAVLTAMSVVVGHLWRPIKVRPALDRQHLVRLMKVGLPIFFFGYLSQVSETFPRLILLAEFGTREVGIFAPAAAALAMFTMLPRAIGQYVGPQLSHRLGETRDPQALWPVAWKTSAAMLLLSLPVAAMGYYLLPPVVATLFPEYVASIPAVRWILLAGVFMGSTMGTGAALSTKAWRWMGLYTTTRVVASYGCPLLLLRVMAEPLEAVALGYAVAQLLAFAMGTWAAYMSTHSARYIRSTQAELVAGG